MKPIKPFEILSTREEIEGTGINCRVHKSTASGDMLETYSIETYVLVPKGQDIDTYLLVYFTEGGWL